MLTEAATPEMIEEWKKIFYQYKGSLKPNKKTGKEVTAYLKAKYAMTPIKDEKAQKIITSTVNSNKALSKKLPSGVKPNPVTYYLDYRGKQVFIGIDLITGYYQVEGSPELHDEICAFQGLDDDDIQNYFCVAQYIKCKANLEKENHRI